MSGVGSAIGPARSNRRVLNAGANSLCFIMPIIWSCTIKILRRHTNRLPILIESENLPLGAVGGHGGGATCGVALGIILHRLSIAATGKIGSSAAARIVGPAIPAGAVEFQNLAGAAACGRGVSGAAPRWGGHASGRPSGEIHHLPVLAGGEVVEGARGGGGAERVAVGVEPRDHLPGGGATPARHQSGHIARIGRLNPRAPQGGADRPRHRSRHRTGVRDAALQTGRRVGGVQLQRQGELLELVPVPGERLALPPERHLQVRHHLASGDRPRHLELHVLYFDQTVAIDAPLGEDVVPVLVLDVVDGVEVVGADPPGGGDVRVQGVLAGVPVVEDVDDPVGQGDDLHLRLQPLLYPHLLLGQLRQHQRQPAHQTGGGEHPDHREPLVVPGHPAAPLQVRDRAVDLVRHLREVVPLPEAQTVGGRTRPQLPEIFLELVDRSRYAVGEEETHQRRQQGVERLRPRQQEQEPPPLRLRMEIGDQLRLDQGQVVLRLGPDDDREEDVGQQHEQPQQQAELDLEFRVDKVDFSLVRHIYSLLLDRVVIRPRRSETGRA